MPAPNPEEIFGLLKTVCDGQIALQEEAKADLEKRHTRSVALPPPRYEPTYEMTLHLPAQWIAKVAELLKGYEDELNGKTNARQAT